MEDNIKVYYEVPYKGGFNSGIHKCNSLQEAEEKSKYSYGDIYKVTSELIQKDGKRLAPKK